MTAAKATTPAAPVRRITIEDVRAKAEHVQDLAQAEVKRVTEADRTKMLIYAAVGVAVLVGVAYYAGSRAARRTLEAPQQLPE